jgi:sugar fermentation stimulation protein A
VLFFCVQHSGAKAARVAGEIDPRYAALLRTALAQGVELLAWRVSLSAEAFTLAEPIEYNVV